MASSVAVLSTVVYVRSARASKYILRANIRYILRANIRYILRANIRYILRANIRSQKSQKSKISIFVFVRAYVRTYVMGEAVH